MFLKVPAQLIYNFKNLYAQHVSNKKELCAQYTNAPNLQAHIFASKKYTALFNLNLNCLKVHRLWRHFLLWRF